MSAGTISGKEVEQHMMSSPPTQALEAQPLPLGHARRKPYCIVLLFPDHMLTDHLPSGDGLVAFGFISALAARGHRLHIIANRTEIRDPLPANVTIHRIGIGGASPRGFAARIGFIVQSRALVRRLLRTESIDLVHQLNPVCNGMSAGMVGLPIPVILGTFVAKWPTEVSPTNGPIVKIAAALREAFRRGVMRFQEHRAAAFLVTTPAALSRFSSSRRVAGRVRWLPHGIDMAAFAPLAAGANAERTVLFLANVSQKKGIFTLLDAFEIVWHEIGDAQLVIAGHGPAFEQVERRVASMQSAPNIHIVGSVKRSAVPRLMADAAVYCLPSFGEPYATTVIEAMACAKPVVVTNSGGLPDMIDDDGGRRVQNGNAVELAAALIEILRSPVLQAQMGAHNRDIVAQQYDWPRVIEKLEAIYLDVIDNRARRKPL